MQISQVCPIHDDAPVLTIKQTAAKLKVRERKVYAMANEGRLPGAVKVDGSWRVLRATLVTWLEPGGDSPPTTIRGGGVAA
ncbi:MAG: helix-turn-helix domain-containing protein [Alphaproteobacteria bacterium]|nr:helix-turn-helix domain-containing protein [Alphaproteobacteria bacterium]